MLVSNLLNYVGQSLVEVSFSFEKTCLSSVYSSTLFFWYGKLTFSPRPSRYSTISVIILFELLKSFSTERNFSQTNEDNVEKFFDAAN